MQGPQSPESFRFLQRGAREPHTRAPQPTQAPAAMAQAAPPRPHPGQASSPPVAVDDEARPLKLVPIAQLS